MDYNELYNAWRREKENAELQALPKNFVAGLADYIKRLREENRMLDSRTTRAKLMKQELENVEKLVKELLQLRYEKILRKTMAGEVVPREVLTDEEEKLHREISPAVEAYRTLIKDVLRGRPPRVEKKEKAETKIMVVRFLQEVPAIIGSDMKTYGPFKPEDIATLPIENARILIKQGLAVEVETRF